MFNRTLICTFVVLATAAISRQDVSAAPQEAGAEHREPVQNRHPLEKTPFVRLPIGSVRAEGWLLDQLELQRDGLTGASEAIYDALQPDSGWLGGDGESWERSPYYVKGLIALAYTLDDEVLKQKAQKWVEWTLGSQREDGFFGPTSNDDWWPRMVALFTLRDYYEATGDRRVVPFLTRYFRHQHEALPDRPLRDWGRARAGDNMDVVLWTYNQTGEPFLLELAKLLAEQAYPWTSIYTDNRFYDFGGDFHPHHIVNVSQALKMPAVLWQVTGEESDRDAFQAGVANLERQYGRVDGQVSGTEMLSGRKSTDGVELCADVERILSNGIALTILGDADLGDQMEKVAYNSFPAHTTADLHQLTYYQFPNQIACTNEGHGFQQDYANANMPGPHSGFPCCCYNWHFGWPKFIQHMWAATSDGGLAVLAYGPNRVTHPIGDTPVTITQSTGYPFREDVALDVEVEQAVQFPLVLRIPGWCEDPQVSLNGERVNDIRPGTFHRIDRQWQSGDRVTLTFPMPVRTSTWANDSVALERGPLAFSLKIDADWRKANDYLDDFDEFEVRPASSWNYALQIDRDSPDVEVTTRPVSDVPFATDAAPVSLRVPARLVPGWGLRERLGTVMLGRADNNYRPLQEDQERLNAESAHRLKVVGKGGRVRVFIDDMESPVIDQDGVELQGGAIGLRSYRTTARYDDVRLNGRLLGAFDDGSSDGWQTYGGEWSAADGQFIVKADPAGKVIYDDSKTDADFTLETTLTVAAGGNAGLIFDVTDPSDRLDGYRGYYVGLATVDRKSEDAEEPPQSPVTSDQPLQTVELIPFGSTRIRVTYFPVLGESNE